MPDYKAQLDNIRLRLRSIATELDEAVSECQTEEEPRPCGFSRGDVTSGTPETIDPEEVDMPCGKKKRRGKKRGSGSRHKGRGRGR